MKYKVLDLFCGAGGLSLGFSMAGYEIVGGVEWDKAAMDTHKNNFNTQFEFCGDINEIQNQEIEAKFSDVDVIIGGPPCQGFSALNRHNKDLQDDPRNRLFLQFLRFVEVIKPKAILIENVRQILTSKDGYAKDTICKMLDEMNYNVKYKVVNAAEFGVPQKRMRAVFVGIRKDLGDFSFDILDKYKVEKFVTVDEALSDLYNIERKDNGKADIYKIDSNVENEYLKIMHDGTNFVHNHYIRYPNENVQNRIKHVPSGGNWKDVPEELFPSKRINRHSNYMKRLDRSGQSITIDTGHDVYFHPIFNRNPTVRESARLQSFPDSFIFTGTKSQQLRQVGNAVPPLLAKNLGLAIKEVLDGENTIVDLFCGAGGLSLGFEKAGFEPILAVDFWGPAIDAFNLNRTNKVGIVKDITTIDEKFMMNYNAKNLSGLVGGPPCQGFSMAGRRILDDDRNKLYRDYFRILKMLNPKFFVMENVVGMLNIANGAIKDDIFERADCLGYKVFLQIMCASDYGVPQNRNRAIFVGIKKSIVGERTFEFPKPVDYTVNCFEALSDLPNLDKGEDNTCYTSKPQTKYQEEMRINSKIVQNHQQTRHDAKTVFAISHVPEGGGMKDLPEEIKGNRKYSSLLRRMDRSKASQTIDTGHRTYFHYKENRIISVREAARLQSFPDDFVFCGSKQNQYKQVGNAVPPKMAYALAKAILKFIKEG